MRCRAGGGWRNADARLPRFVCTLGGMRSFGDHLRRWRRERSLSQLALAMRADTSARHVSLLESGRSAPGREMVLRLAEALDVSAAERDQALKSAGLSPQCRRAPLSAADALAVDRALDTLLEGHGRLPAFVLDADWCLTRCNAGGERLLKVLSRAPFDKAGPAWCEPDPLPPGPLNLIDLLVAHANTNVIVNWAEVARHALARARAEIVRREEHAPAFDASVEKLAIACASRAHAALADGDESDTDRDAGEDAADDETSADAAPSLVVPFTVDACGTRLSLISMVAQFGGIEHLDVEVPSVELMFAADERTGRWFGSELPEALTEPA